MKIGTNCRLRKALLKNTPINIDLSQLNKVDVDDNNIANTNTMLNFK